MRKKKSTKIKAKTPNQKKLVEAILNIENKYIFCQGPAGSGKTLLSLANAIDMIKSDLYDIDGLVYVRANVGIESEKDIGSLPGGVNEKLQHLIYPLIDNLNILMTSSEVNLVLASEIIEVMPVALMRGRSFNNKIIIVDEAQNISVKGMLTILTRLGFNSKMILIGDKSQSDLSDKLYATNGFEDAIWRLEGLEGIKLVKLGIDDIIRNKIISSIITRYES